MRRLALLALLVPLAARAEVVVRFAPQHDAVGCSGTLVARSSGGVTRTAVASLDRPVTLATGTQTHVTFESDCWAAPLAIGPEASQAELVVWPGARIGGKLELPRGSAPPARIALRVQSAPQQRPSLAPADLECAVERQRWSCAVPAGKLDLRVAAEGFAPHYLWEVALAPRERRDIGTLALKHGASVGGWASASDGPITVELAPREFLRGPTPPERRSARSERVTPNRRGFFQFHGVAAGVYDVVATTPNRSRATATIEVTESGEHVLATELTLQPPARLEVAITPAREPQGGRWSVMLEREIPGSNAVEPVTKGVATEDGRWIHEGVEPGRYVVHIADEAGTFSETQRVDVGDGDVHAALNLPLVPVRGKVTLGRDPLPASLRFDGNGTRVQLRTNEDGEFTGVLTRPGRWDVHVLSQDEKFNAIRRVEVRLNDDGSDTVLDLELPDGRVRGRVTDERGAAVAGASVLVFRDNRLGTTAITGPDGTFDLRGVERGQVFLRAHLRGGDSGLVPFDVNDAASPVQLVVRKLAKVNGWLTTGASEPVAGALVRYFAPTLPGRREAVTGPGGEFTLELPAGTPSVSIVILAQGLPVKVATLRTDVAEAQQLVIGRRGGMLTMPMTRETPMPWMTASGVPPFPMSALLFPPDGTGLPRGVRPEGMAIDIEPGTYSICAEGAQPCQTVQITAGLETAVAPPTKG